MTQPNLLQNILTGNTVSIKGTVDNSLSTTCVLNPSTCCGVSYPGPGSLISQLTYEITNLNVPSTSGGFAFNSDVSSCCTYPSGVGGVATGLEVRLNTVKLPNGTVVGSPVCNTITSDKPCGGEVSVTCPVATTCGSIPFSAFAGKYRLDASSFSNAGCSNCAAANGSFELIYFPLSPISYVLTDPSGSYTAGSEFSTLNGCAYISNVIAGNPNQDLSAGGEGYGGICVVGDHLASSTAFGTGVVWTVALHNGSPGSGQAVEGVATLGSNQLMFQGPVGFSPASQGFYVQGATLANNSFFPNGTTVTGFSSTAITVSSNAIASSSGNVSLPYVVPTTNVAAILWHAGTPVVISIFDSSTFNPLGSNSSPVLTGVLYRFGDMSQWYLVCNPGSVEVTAV